MVISTPSKTNILDLIDSVAYDEQLKWYFLNRLWYKSDYRKDFYDFFRTYWETTIEPVANQVLVIPEGLSSSFGVFPFVSQLAFEKKYPLVIWKEFGDMLTTRPYFFPNENFLEEGQSSIVIQDVTSKGTTLRKIAQSFSKIGWTISKFISVIQISDGQTRKELDSNRFFSSQLLKEEIELISIIEK